MSSPGCHSVAESRDSQIPRKMQPTHAPANLPESPAGTARSPFGRSCENCAQTKIKCSWSPGVTRCDRCNRLNKECVPSIPRPGVQARRKARRATADLEQRLNGLISMITANPGSVDATAVSSTLNINLPQSTVTPSQNQSQNQDQSQGQIQDKTPEFALPQPVPAMASTHVSSLVSPAPDIVPEEAEQCLDTFKTLMLKFFPFLHIPQSMTARQLYGVRPFLWYCIMAISCKSTAKQVALSETVRRSIAQGIVMDHNRNIDLLLGLLVFIGWLSFQVHSKPFATLYVQLALAIVHDLGLNKPVPKEQPIFQTAKAGPGEQPWVRPVRTMEERRAVLGCYYITSVISLYMQKFPGLAWTPYLDECLRVLAAEKESPNDEVLVHIVRSQLIVERASQVPRSETEDDTNSCIPFYIKALMTQLDDFKRQIPVEEQNNEPVLLHTHYAVHVVHELALYSRAPMVPNSSADTFHRIHHLYTCLHAVKSSFDLIFALPPSSYIGFPSSSMFPQMTHNLATLFKLCTLNEPGWDRTLARSTADPLQCLDRFIERMEIASRESGLINDHPEGDVLTRAVKLTRRMRQFWEAKMVAAGVISVSVDAAGASRTPGGGGSGNEMGSGLLEGVMDYQGVPDTFHVDWFDAACMSKFLEGLDG